MPIRVRPSAVDQRDHTRLPAPQASPLIAPLPRTHATHAMGPLLPRATRLSVLLLLASAVVSLPPPPPIPDRTPPMGATARSVVVIGAGLAGVAAARQLHDAGLNVTVLEARNRTGGRLHSVQTAAGRVDLGAMWIHEAGPANPLNRLAARLNLTLSPLVQYGAGQLFAPDGGNASLTLYAATYVSYVTQLQRNITALRAAEAAAAAAANTTRPADLPFSQLYSDWLAANAATWQPQQVPLAHALMTINVQNLLNANITRASVLRIGDAKTLPASDVHIAQGFDALPQALAAGLDVRVNTVVTNVSQDDTGVVTVTTANGSTLTAGHVLVTVPLGVLKAGAIAFSPPLPAAKQAAIRDMGMGVLEKVVLVFRRDDVFWSHTADFVIRAPSDWSGRWTSWLSYYRLLGLPVLVGLNSADTARELEGMSDEAVVADALQVLASCFKGRQLPQPVESHVTRWAGDEFARGSYSYYAVGNPRGITDVLAAPHGRVLFAGEATSTKMATALGALLSGQGEAGRIINTTRSAQGSAA